ncbi:hypothetical protein [Modicisalibacter luteus]|uniref:Uncharacterized protein n=1 Tax=Modicisalibacter luteus TaxID=453962 RepID=A0ABV7LWP8_9GAMM|nr:hypothetical protein [Halomonas lutea]GHB03942.1 hypothetical protein GCM10007159_27280 [Halomonas lutea]
MPLKLEGSITVQVGTAKEDLVHIDAKDLVYKEGGMRVLGDKCTQHEFLYAYQEPRFSLSLTSTVLDGIVQSSDLSIEAKADSNTAITQDTINVSFEHDPDQDDEPLTPISSN